MTNGMTYIGQTNRSIEERWKEHCKPALKSRSHLSNAIQKYGKENFNIKVLQLANSQNELDLLEEQFIQLNKSMSPNGYNLKHGGLGGSLSEQAKEKLRKYTGRKPSKETLQKLREANLGRPNINSRAVIGTNIKTGEIIEMRHAYELPERFHYNCVHRCAKGERKKHKGFTWRYK